MPDNKQNTKKSAGKGGQVDAIVSLQKDENDKNRLAFLWVLLNISTEIDIETDKIIEVMNAVEKKINRDEVLNTIWKADYKVYANGELFHKRYLSS